MFPIRRGNNSATCEGRKWPDGHDRAESGRRGNRTFQAGRFFRMGDLDGGGSTVMLLGDLPQNLEVKNRPSDPTGLRPIPVMPGIRRVKLEPVAGR